MDGCGSAGPRSSALVGGHTHIHAELEAALAALKGAAACLLFPTGFAANLGAVAALAGPGTAVFSDELNHASIVDGTRLASRAGVRLAACVCSAFCCLHSHWAVVPLPQIHALRSTCCPLVQH